MTPRIKNLLTIFLKNAVNAVLASGILKVLISGNFQFNTPNDWWNFGKSLFSVILAREIMVWGPIILQWSKTDADPSMKIFTSHTKEAATDSSGAPVTVEKTVTVKETAPVNPKP